MADEDGVLICEGPSTRNKGHKSNRKTYRNENYDLLEDKLRCRKCSQEYSLTTGATVLKDQMAKKHPKVNTLDRFLDNKKERAFCKNNTDDLLAKFVVKHQQPSRIVEDESFRAFIVSLNAEYKLPSRETIRSRITRDYNTYQESIKDLLLKHTSGIALTCDIWTSIKQKPYAVITGHLINSD